MAGLTRWVLAHKLVVAVAWALVTVLGVLSFGPVTSQLSGVISLPGYEGYETNQLLWQRFHSGGNAPPSAVVITLPSNTSVDTPAVKTQLTRAFSSISRTLPGARLVSYVSTSNRAFVSADDRTMFALIFARGNVPLTTSQLAHAVPLLSRAREAGAQIHVTGIRQLQHSGPIQGPGVVSETLLALIAALIILAFVFRSFLAGIPVLMAVIAIPTTFLLIGVLTLVTDVSVLVQYFVALIGLGIAIDYSLLIVMRWREERARGAVNEEAVVSAMASAGKAVGFSGLTVAVGLMSLVVLPVPFLRSVGYAGMLIPLVSVAVALTVLPVVLAVAGPLLDGDRSTHADQPSRVWSQWGRLVLRGRWLAVAAAVIILAVLLVPVTAINVGDPAVGDFAHTGDAYAGVRQLERAGIGTGILRPFEMVVPEAQVPDLVSRVSAVHGIRGVVAPAESAWRRGGLAVVDALPALDPDSAGGRNLLERVRAAAHAASPQARVGGSVAQADDFVSAVYGKFPVLLGLVVLVTYLLLAWAFRSLLLPLKAVVLVLVTVGAACGAIVLVWQQGHGSSQIWGIDPTGSITPFVPLMLFAFLFGLSTDYEVFILVRMREAFDRTARTDEAVMEGVARTGRLVTSAALILLVAFLSLSTGRELVVKMFATGMAVGIVLDATVVRMLLVPALVSLFGRWSWWLPRSRSTLAAVPEPD